MTFKEDTTVRPTGLNQYAAYFHPAWCVGTVPHGGYVASTFLSVVKCHFATVRASYNQPHTIATQLTFLRRSALGPATFTVTESKLGRRTSTLHIVLTQGDDSLPLVIGSLTQSDLENESGISLPITHNLFPPRPPSISKDVLRNGTDPEWILYENPFSEFRKASQNLVMFVPRKQQATPGLIDLCLTMRGQRFSQESLGYVVDSFPQLVESPETTSHLEKEMKKLQVYADDVRKSERPSSEVASDSVERALWANFWYPTVLLNMEVKKALPLEGAEWLYSRVATKQIRNGRLDIDVIVFDEKGDIVALSNHVALIYPAARNMVRTDKGHEAKGSKL